MRPLRPEQLAEEHGAVRPERLRRDSRLTKTEDSESTSTFSYDDFGSVVAIKQTLKAANTIFPPVGQLPDLPASCGDLSADAGTTLYCFDEFERMVAAKGPGLTKDPAVYEYDGLDRRDSKTVKSATGDKRRDYSYVGTSRIAYIGRDPDRPSWVRRRFDLTGSELLRLTDRGVPFKFIPRGRVRQLIGRP